MTEEKKKNISVYLPISAWKKLMQLRMDEEVGSFSGFLVEPVCDVIEKKYNDTYNEGGGDE